MSETTDTTKPAPTAVADKAGMNGSADANGLADALFEEIQRWLARALAGRDLQVAKLERELSRLEPRKDLAIEILKLQRELFIIRGVTAASQQSLERFLQDR